MTPADHAHLRLKAEASRDMPSDVFLAILDQLTAAEVASRGYLERAQRAETARDAVAAAAWDEGHETPWERERDDCRCAAWSRSECACGRYGGGRIITPNPYRKAEPAKVEQLAVPRPGWGRIMTRDELADLAAQPYALTPKRSHYHALQQALALLDAEVAAHAQTRAHLAAAMGQTGRRC